MHRRRTRRSGGRVDGRRGGLRLPDGPHGRASRSTATQPSSIENESIQITGSASIAASGTVHRRSVRAPQITIDGRDGDPDQQDAHCVPPSWRSSAIQSRQTSGANTNETAAIAAVVPSAIASARHSRRTANHSRPTPG